jgi:iron only hydrogenase large subunit-like protein
MISEQDCVGCGDCIKACDAHNLAEIREAVPIFGHINEGQSVYALIAPAYISQFGPEVSPGRLRAAFKKLGFAGMIEVALFADILTLKEALEFDESVKREEDFVLTSCCCPMWVAMIQKVYGQLMPHVPPSVSPMVACGRAIKTLHSDVKTVFVGPCIAKKAEARQTDVADAVDYVLTFREAADIFSAAGIDPAVFKEDLRDHSSAGGRLYARTGGVSEAVASTLEMLRPGRTIPLKSRQADGVPACKQMLREVMEGHADANFIEGMGCVGGCVGGPRALISHEEGAKNVDAYAERAGSRTPVNNAYVLDLLSRLGFDTIESLISGDNMLTRRF